MTTKDWLRFVNLVVVGTPAPTVFVVVVASYVITTRWLTLAIVSALYRWVVYVWRRVFSAFDKLDGKRRAPFLLSSNQVHWLCELVFSAALHLVSFAHAS